MHKVIGQGEGGTMLEDAPAGAPEFDFLSGDVMTTLWNDEAGVATMAAKKKPAKKPTKKPAKKPAKKPKPRPTRNRPGCDTTSVACSTHR